jgi:hypothetical protein
MLYNPRDHWTKLSAEVRDYLVEHPQWAADATVIRAMPVGVM